MDYLYTRQAGKWSEAIYNEDGYYKYEQPLIEGYLDYSQSHENPQTIKTGAYLYALQGSREMYGKWIWKNRFLHLDSKFLAGSILGDTAVFRTYTPAVWEGVEPCADLTLTAFNAMYFNVKWGSVTKSVRVGFNETKTMTAPEGMQFNDTETIIYGASLIASLGDLSPLYPGTVDVSKMSRLKELIVGSGVEGYQNRNLRSLSIGTNRMLKKLDVRNCPEYSEPIELRNCTNIEEIYAQGTAITAVNLPEGGNLAKLYLPGTITNLTLKNQPKLLDAFFELAGVEKLSTIISESTPGVNIFPIVDRCLSMKNPALSRVRLIDLNATGANLDILYKLIKLGGVDEKGNNVATAVVTGKFHAVTAVEDKLAAIRAAFPELTVTYTNLKATTVTTFTFSSSQSKTITNSTFECNFEAVKVSETTYKVTADDDSVIDFTFRCDNHVDYSDTYLVAGTRSQSYSVTYIPLRTIRVKVYNQSLYIENARVIIGNDVYVTDADGYVTLKRGGEAVSGTVEAAGYAGNTFSFAAITNDTTHTVEVYAAVEVKFIVKDDLSNSVEGAAVSCDGKEAITNLYGECILLLGKGTLSYTVTHPNCLDYIGEINIGTSAISVNVSLFLNPIVFKPKENGNIQMAYSGVRVADIGIISTTTDYIINCGGGDGSRDIAKGTNSSYEHTYASKGIYQVEISNCENITKTYGGRYSLYAYWSIGNSKINDMKFDQYQEIRYVGLVFENDINRQNFKDCFFYCQSLLFYAKGLLDKCVKAQDFTEFMGYCGRLQTVYVDTFDNCTEINAFSYCHSRCYGLSKVVIPANVSNLGINTYYSCRGLKYIKAITITPQTIGENVFYDTNNCPIYVPDESVDAYKTATNWSELAARIKPMSDFATDFPDEVLEEETV